MNRRSIKAMFPPVGPLKMVSGATIAFVLLLSVLALFAPADWWQTPDQRAQGHFDAGDYVLAAQEFSSPERRGVAWFRAGEFKSAVSEFGRVNTATGYFNQGTAQVMAGQYTEAIDAYDKALKLRPDWTEATNNREIARLRADRIERVGGDMTGGMLGADEVVFDKEKRSSGGGQEQIEGGGELSDQELQAMWLRRIQTRPKDFLRIKFAFQLATRQADEDKP